MNTNIESSLNTRDKLNNVIRFIKSLSFSLKTNGFIKFGRGFTRKHKNCDFRNNYRNNRTLFCFLFLNFIKSVCPTLNYSNVMQYSNSCRNFFFSSHAFAIILNAFTAGKHKIQPKCTMAQSVHLTVRQSTLGIVEKRNKTVIPHFYIMCIKLQLLYHFDKLRMVWAGVAAAFIRRTRMRS